MLARLLYASRSAGPVTDEVIASILAQSRKNNAELGITGVLCVCHDGVFMQVLEGGRAEVNGLYAKVIADKRHTEVVLLDYAEIDERRFSGWRMGRVDLDRVNAGIILKYSDRARLDPFTTSGRVAMRLMEELISTASIMGGS